MTKFHEKFITIKVKKMLRLEKFNKNTINRKKNFEGFFEVDFIGFFFVWVLKTFFEELVFLCQSWKAH